MNCSSINIVLNTCLKLDLSRHRLFSRFYSGQLLEHRKYETKGAGCRYFRTTQNSKQAEEDDTTVLLSPKEVTFILQKNEFNKEFTTGAVRLYDSNQLASNDPIEDTRSEAHCKLTSGLLMGVFDGHGGPACAQVVSKRLLSYIAATLLPVETLNTFIKDVAVEKLMEIHNDRILACVALAYGRPEPPVGYSYSAPSSSFSGASAHGGHRTVSVGHSSGSISLGAHSAGGLSGFAVSGASGVSFGGDAGFGNGGYAGGYSGAPLVQKHIYVHVPPPEQEEQRLPRISAVAPPQKHYKIIFIKAPTPPTPIAPIIPVQPQNEEKTLVYVLVKKPEEQPDIIIPTPAPTQPAKPEVYFIKYQTQKESGIGGGALGGGAIGGGALGGGALGGGAGSIGGGISGDDLSALSISSGSASGVSGGAGGHSVAEISSDFGTSSGGDEGLSEGGHSGATSTQYGPPGHVAGPLH